MVPDMVPNMVPNMVPEESGNKLPRSKGLHLVVTHISDPIRPGTLWVRMVNKAEWLERIRRRQTTPTGSSRA
jgi:hypothetical protein